MKFLEIRCPALWMLCLLALVAVGCGEGGGSESIQSDANYAPVQESRIEESLDVEFRTDFRKSDKDNNSVIHQEDGDSDSVKEVLDVVVEEVEEDHREMTSDSQADPELESMGQQVVELAVDPIEPDTSQPFHSAQVVPEVVRDSETPALDDRTQGNVVKLVVDSITLNDCVMRGEIHNYSDDQYARNVTVSIGSLDDDERLEWHWPLTMKPGESAPFEVKVNWFPHTYNVDNPDGGMQHSLNINHWNVFGNTYVDLKTDLSFEPDLKRAFEFNSDGTEHRVLWQNPYHKFLVYDERALELENSKDWYRYGREYSVISRPMFAYALPGEVVADNDSEPMVSEFTLYRYSDVFYVPSQLYPETYEKGVDDTVSNVKVYQAYKRGPKVVDIRELVPHSIFEEVDTQGLVIDRKLKPVSDFTNYDVSDGEKIYLQLLDSFTFPTEFPNRNVDGEASTHREEWSIVSYELWVGGVSHSEVATNGNTSNPAVNSKSDSCYAAGPLCVGEFALVGQIAHQRRWNLGRIGTCPSFEADPRPTHQISVDHDSVSVEGQEIRGFIYNASETDFARDVTVAVTRSDTGIQIGTWRWPLSVQPGERVPFEIQHSELAIGIELLDVQASATLSEWPDPTRSFLLESYSYGTIYGDDVLELYGYRPFVSRYPEYYNIEEGDTFDHNVILLTPDIRYTKDKFLEMYRGVISAEDVYELELFDFRDIYARLEPPDSHPELAKIATTQYIHDLRAYAAIVDSGGQVVDVKEVPIFTPVYGEANTSLPYAKVNVIPAPNRWSPNAVRLLVIVPYADEADLNSGYRTQVWIGGATEAVG